MLWNLSHLPPTHEWGRSWILLWRLFPSKTVIFSFLPMFSALIGCLFLWCLRGRSTPGREVLHTLLLASGPQQRYCPWCDGWTGWGSDSLRSRCLPQGLLSQSLPAAREQFPQPHHLLLPNQIKHQRSRPTRPWMVGQLALDLDILGWCIDKSRQKAGDKACAYFFLDAELVDVVLVLGGGEELDGSFEGVKL